MSDESELKRLIDQAVAGDESAMAELFDKHRQRLKQVVQLRLDRRVQGRLDASDVLQDAYVDAWKGLSQYTSNPVLPFYLWLRMITCRKMHALHRTHLEAQVRDARREVSLKPAEGPEATSEFMAAQLLGGLTSPSQAALREELQGQLQDALNGMDPMDREMLALRHFEQLGNAEAAQVLGIDSSAASNRYVRALERLKHILERMPGFSDV